MTPTSPLGGVLTGLLDGFVVVLAVMIVAMLVKRRRRPVAVRARPSVTTRHPAPVTSVTTATAVPTLSEAPTGAAHAA